MKKRYIILIILLAISLIFVLTHLRETVFSYYSVVSSCFDSDEYLKEQGVQTAGEFITTYNITTKTTTNTIILYDEDEETLHHELCHLKQQQQHRLFPCLLLPLAYLNEIECYTVSDWKNSTFHSFYG